MNVRRGAHRVFAVACVLWVLFVIVGLPLQELQRRSESYRVMLGISLDNRRSLSFDDVYNSQVLVDMRRNLGIQAVYRDHFAEWPALLALIVIPPVLVYALVAGLMVVGRWITVGFRS
jgi:hypothetical protein